VFLLDSATMVCALFAAGSECREFCALDVHRPQVGAVDALWARAGTYAIVRLFYLRSAMGECSSCGKPRSITSAERAAAAGQSGR
jgi:hypothetical protein